MTELDAFGPLLNAQEFARVLGISEQQFYKNRKREDYDRFKTDPPIGHRCYSKQLIARWLAGERIDRERERVFGRKVR